MEYSSLVCHNMCGKLTTHINSFIQFAFLTKLTRKFQNIEKRLK